MGGAEQSISKGGSGSGQHLTFDQHVQQLPKSKQTIHFWTSRLALVAFALVVGFFIYAIYASISWKSVGESQVVRSWLYFFLAGAIGVLLLGVDSLNVGASIPPPFGAMQTSFETGRPAIQAAWSQLGIGFVIVVLVLVGLWAVGAGRFGLENWIQVVAGFWAIVGLGALAGAVLRRILRAR